jgi:selenocysteine lyase/cysteine desulfurase
MLSRKIAYLNCAYMSPMLKKVEKAGRKGISSKRKPYKVSPEDFFRDGETARLLFAQLVNAGEPKRNVLIPSVSYALANVASNLPKKKGNIIITEGQFPSNVYPWQAYEIKTVAQPSEGKSWSEAIIEAINENTAAVCLGHVHWIDGSLFDLKSIGEVARKHQAALVVDGTQSIGALPFDIHEIRPDALVVAGYKWLFGPYGIGMAYYGEMFDNGKPIEQNWINRLGSENFGGLVNYVDEYQPGALRYEVGEHSNFILLPMFIAALKQILKWTPKAIQEYVGELSAETIQELTKAGYLISQPGERANHLFGVRFGTNINPDRVKGSLAKHKVNVSFRGDAIRVAPHLYNDQKDMDRLRSALLEVS